MSDNSQPQPVVVLVEPQLGANIGMCARAMLNCGWRRLRLVRPREGWPQEEALAAAADADEVLAQAEVFDSLGDAIGDCRRVYATTARDRSLAQPVLTAEEAGAEICGLGAEQGGVALLFGPEASGLDADAVARADTLVRFPTNPGFPSLNLAQAVLLFGWEWRRATGRTSEIGKRGTPGTREAMENFFGRLFGVLDEKGFFLTDDLRPHAERSIRGLFTRTRATGREIRLLHGILTALTRDDRTDRQG